MPIIHEDNDDDQLDVSMKTIQVEQQEENAEIFSGVDATNYQAVDSAFKHWTTLNNELQICILLQWHVTFTVKFFFLVPCGNLTLDYSNINFSEHANESL